MTTMNETGNQLILDFMQGYESMEVLHFGELAYMHNGDTIDDKDLTYNSSWDALMPVIKKIKESPQPDGWHFGKGISDALVDIDIDRAYREVVEYLKFQKDNT